MKNIGFIGDLHAGSHYAPLPEEELPVSKTRWPGIRYLNRCFAHLVDSWPRLDLLVLMGDLIEGRQRKADSTGIFSANLSDQVGWAIALLEPLAQKSRRIVRVDGTPYHEEYHNALAELDVTLKVQKTAQVLDLEIGGEILNVAHHPMGGHVLYRGTKVDREGLWATIATASKKVPRARWIVRAHNHEYMLQETEMITVVLTPCWQLPTPYAKKSAYWRYQPTLGGVLMKKDSLAIGGYRFLPTFYDVPQPKPIKL